MADSVSDLNPQQLIQQLRSRGVSIPEISRVLGRNSRMIYKVFRGESKGDLYKPALEDLARDGWTDKIPPRRRSKNGELVKVRAPHGAPEATITPVDKGGRYAAGKQGGRFREDTAFGPNGRRRHQLHIPKKGKVGRAQANDELLRLARSAARGQSKDTQKRVNVELTFANGRRMSCATTTPRPCLTGSSTKVVEIRSPGSPSKRSTVTRTSTSPKNQSPGSASPL